MEPKKLTKITQPFLAWNISLSTRPVEFVRRKVKLKLLLYCKVETQWVRGEHNLLIKEASPPKIMTCLLEWKWILQKINFDFTGEDFRYILSDIMIKWS